MKYLTFLNEHGAGMHIWMGGTSHVDMQAQLKQGDARSAGFLKLLNGRLIEYGRSVSLNLGPAPGDGVLAEKYLKDN